MSEANATNFFAGNLTLEHFKVNSQRVAEPNRYEIDVKPANKIPKDGIFKFDFPFISVIPDDSVAVTVTIDQQAPIVRTEANGLNIFLN